MKEVKREFVGSIAFGAFFMFVGWLIPRVLDDTRATCNSLAGRLEQAQSTGMNAKCSATGFAYDFQPFFFWMGLIILLIGLGGIALAYFQGTGARSPEAGLKPQPPANAVSAATLASDAIRLLEDAEAETAGQHTKDAADSLYNLVERRLDDVDQADVLDDFYSDRTPSQTRALTEVIARCAEDDPDFARELLVCINSDSIVAPPPAD
jgi:hypothetical protein